MGKDGADHTHNAPEIRVDLPLEFVDEHLFERADQAVAGVVRHDIDAAKGLDGYGNQPTGRGPVGCLENGRAAAM
jgi:hypothetical protein